jgi:hypothetical protein
MMQKVDPLVLAKLFNDPRSARFLSIDTHGCGKAVDALTNVDQFRANGKEFTPTNSIGLTNGDEMFPFSCRVRRITPSVTN